MFVLALTELAPITLLLKPSSTPPLRKTDPLLLTKTDPLYARVSVGEAELNGMTGGEDGSFV